jgi:hypothetical protein
MAQGSKKPPHEILGVAPDADYYKIMQAYNRQHARLGAAQDDMSVARRTRLKDAFIAMSEKSLNFRATRDPLLDDGFGGLDPLLGPVRHRPYAPPVAHRLSAREKFEERTGNYRATLRIRQLAADWNDYMRTLRTVPRQIKQIKAETGDRFIRLKALFPGNDEAKTLWAAESYLRRGQERQGLFSLSELRDVIYSLQRAAADNMLEKVHMQYLDMAEDDLKDRVNGVRQAFEVLRHKRRYIDHFLS